MKVDDRLSLSFSFHSLSFFALTFIPSKLTQYHLSSSSSDPTHASPGRSPKMATLSGHLRTSLFSTEKPSFFFDSVSDWQRTAREDRCERERKSEGREFGTRESGRERVKVTIIRRIYKSIEGLASHVSPNVCVRVYELKF